MPYKTFTMFSEETQNGSEKNNVILVPSDIFHDRLGKNEFRLLTHHKLREPYYINH